MLRFRLFNIPVFVHPWFWLTLALIGGGLRANDTTALIEVAMFVLAGFVSVLVHEFGHALMIKKYRLPTEVHLVAFGGFARYPAGHLNRKQMLSGNGRRAGDSVCVGYRRRNFAVYPPLPRRLALGDRLDLHDVGQLCLVHFELPSDPPNGWRTNAGCCAWPAARAAGAFDRHGDCGRDWADRLLCAECTDPTTVHGLLRLPELAAVSGEQALS